MGHYSTLFIGDEERNWKYDIPSFLTFLFEESDFYRVKEDDAEEFITFGYQSTSGKVLERLENYGFNTEMFEYVYSSLYDDLDSAVEDLIDSELWEQSENSEIKFNRLKRAHAKKFHPLPLKEQLRDFPNFYVPILQAYAGKKTTKVTSIDGRTYTLKKGSMGHADSEWDFYFYKRYSLFILLNFDKNKK